LFIFSNAAKIVLCPLFTVDSTLDPSNLKTSRTPETKPGERANRLNRQAALGDRIVGLASKLEPPIPRRTVFELLADLKRGGLLKQPENRGKYEPA
jgi:hypothetical protein